ncbi:MAG TPA: O-antigen ligase family protein [Bacteroidia bacterium]
MSTIKQIVSNKNLFLFGLVLIIVGLPLSKFLMSVGQFVLLGNWIIEGDWKRKWQVMKTSRVLWVMSSFFVLHLVGLCWTSDFDYAFNDIKIKLPLLWFPLLFITSKPIEKKIIQYLLWLFTASVFVASIVCTMVWLGLTKHKVVDIRDISIFNSHIRFALMIDLVICFLVYDFFKTGSWYLYLIKSALIIWLVVFLGIMQSFTGIVVLIIVLVYYCFLLLKKLKRPIIKVAALIVIAMVGGGMLFLVIKEINEQRVPLKPLKRLVYTPSGNFYYNDFNSKESENGNLIWANICVKELEKEWNKRSDIDFNGLDKKGNSIGSTLIRYLSSLGLNKDSVAISKLKQADISWVEKGTTNYLYTNRTGIEARVHEIIYEYDAFQKGKNPTGHSFLMRLEFWRVGFDIIKRKTWFGVGTGDVQRAYNNQYVLSGSQLKKDWRLRSHNQFMATTITFGVIGLVIFLLYLFYPVIATPGKHYLFISFFMISILSMLNEDTLETQAGVTFFGFFYCLLLSSNNEVNWKENSNIAHTKNP